MEEQRDAGGPAIDRITMRLKFHNVLSDYPRLHYASSRCNKAKQMWWETSMRGLQKPAR